jgi:hypothetical protein
MGLGFHDGFAPTEPLYHLTEKFWDYDDLRSEAMKMKKDALEFRDDPIIIRALPATDQTPALNELKQSFEKKYTQDFGIISYSYMYINAGEDYPWHVDNVAAKAVSDLPPVQCAINILVSGEENDVEFITHGYYNYKAALFNTSIKHRITPKTDRIITRISFRERVYSEVLDEITQNDI